MRIGFRTRLLIILALFAVIPAAVLTGAAGWAASFWLPRIAGTGAWEEVAETGRAATAVAESFALTPEQEAAIAAHRDALNVSLTNARRLSVLTESTRAVVLLALFALLLLGLATSRVAGHLSRQLSRPLRELVGWTELIARGDPLPEEAQTRGAPEFGMLRQRMRRMAREISQGRARAIENERLRVMRESARQVAHELKNPLTPISFAVARLKREAPESLQEAVQVLEVETRRMEGIALSFSQFGKLPEGPKSEIDLGELLTYAATSGKGGGVTVRSELTAGLPVIVGHHDALARALSNVVLNAVEACEGQGEVVLAARRANGGVEISVRDSGKGIPSDRINSIWDPYVTGKPGGTGLGLAIVRQTVEAHGGRVSAESTPGAGTTIRMLLGIGEAGADTADRTGQDG